MCARRRVRVAGAAVRRGAMGARLRAVDRWDWTIAKSARPSRVRQVPPEVRCWTLTGRTSRSALSGYPDKADYAEFGVMRTRRWMPWHGGEAGRVKTA